MRKSTVLSSVAVLAFALAAPARAQEPEVSVVRVIDRATRQPVPEARVGVVGAGFAAFTDSAGVARLDPVPAGPHVIEVSRLGYRASRASVTPTGGRRGEIVVELSVAALAAEPVAVRGESENAGLRTVGFYERRAERNGVFLTREEIDRVQGQRFHDLMRRVPGVSVYRWVEPGKPAVYRIGSRRGQTRISRGGPQPPCDMQIYLDGVPLATENALDVLHPNDIEAIEVYAGPARVPLRYVGRGNACGVILVWSRSRV